MTTEKFIKNSLKKQILERKEYTLFNKVDIFIKDQLPKSVDMTNVVSQVEKRLPRNLTYNLDTIYVGQFPELNKREVESVYLDGAIFISNNQEDEYVMATSIIHEVAHSLEEEFGELIYGDSLIIDEFIGKRKKLADLLRAQGFQFNDPKVFLKTSFDENFDEFLYKQVGYERLTKLTNGLFASPYASTSLREYFSNGFENYFCGDNNYLSKISPKLYSKILSLTKEI